MATATRGYAQINSGFGSVTFDVILYAEPQSMKASQEWDDTKVKDRNGLDCSRQAKNERYTGEIGFKLLGDNSTNAAKINTVAPGGFLPKLSTVIIAGVSLTAGATNIFNASWTVESGCDIMLKNDDCADFNLKLGRYADSTQNTLMVSTPA